MPISRIQARAALAVGWLLAFALSGADTVPIRFTVKHTESYSDVPLARTDGDGVGAVRDVYALQSGRSTISGSMSIAGLDSTGLAEGDTVFGIDLGGCYRFQSRLRDFPSVLGEGSFTPAKGAAATWREDFSTTNWPQWVTLETVRVAYSLRTHRLTFHISTRLHERGYGLTVLADGYCKDTGVYHDTLPVTIRFGNVVAQAELAVRARVQHQMRTFLGTQTPGEYDSWKVSALGVYRQP